MSAKSTKPTRQASVTTTSDKQVIFMVGNSRGAKSGTRRTVDTATAARLVRDGLAKYPASKR